MLRNVVRIVAALTSKKSAVQCKTERLFRPKLESLEERRLLTASWIAEGPSPIINGQNTIPPNNPAAGAVEDVAVDPANPQEIVAATVNGGVWRTQNFAPATPGATTWSALTDGQSSLSTGSIAFSPLDPTGNTFFAGTGSFSNFGEVGGPRIGVLRSTDGGNTFNVFPVNAGNETKIKTVLPTAINLAASPNVDEMVLVAGIENAGGLYRSNDNGQTFTLISGTLGLPTGSVSQVIEDPDNSQTFYAAIPGQGVFQGQFNTASQSITWTPFNTGLTGVAGSANIQLTAHAFGGTTVIYAGLANSSGAISVFRLATSSSTWTALAAPPSSLNAYVLGQSGFDMVADPTNSQVVYLAGIGGGNNIGRFNPTGGGSWTIIEGPGGALNGTEPHADSRDMTFLGSNVLIESDDGGIYFIQNPLNATNNSWQSLNGNTASGQGLGDAEVHSVAWDSNSNVIVGGTQDNGTVVQTTPGSQVWTQMFGGDGGNVAIDNFTLAGANQSIRYISAAGFDTFFQRQVFDADNHQVGASISLIPSGGLPGFVDQFDQNPVAIDSVAPPAGQSTRIVIGGGTDSTQSVGMVYEADNAGIAPDAAAVNWVAVPTGPGFGSVSALVSGGTLLGVSNPDVLYAGSGNQVFVRTTAGGTLTATSSPFPGQNVTAIALDPTDWQRAVVTSSTGVWETQDGGGSWSVDLASTGHLNNTNIQTVQYVDGNGVDAILVGGQSGVFRMLMNDPGAWTRLGQGLPNAITYSLQYNAASDILVAGTVGRGAFAISDAKAAIFALVPEVTNVLIDSTSWTIGFMHALQTAGEGNGNGYAIPVGSLSQFTDLPWTNLNEIQISFNENVNVQENSLSVTGVNVPTYAFSGFTYNPSTFTATWTLAGPIGADRLSLDLHSTGPNAVTDTSGDPLDGEWSNGSSVYPSGDGIAGGDFNFSFNVLPGDVTQDGIVNAQDIAVIASQWLQTGGLAGDTNGDGIVNSQDIEAIASNWLAALPGGVYGVYANRATFNAASTNLTTIDFEGLTAPGTFQYYGNPGSLSLSGVNFQTNGELFVQNNNTYGTGAYLSPQDPPTGSDVTVVTLPAGITAVGTDFYSNNPVTVTLSTGQSYSLQSPSFPNLGFFGVISSIPISSLSFSVSSGMDLDNFSFGQAAASPNGGSSAGSGRIMGLATPTVTTVLPSGNRTDAGVSTAMNGPFVAQVVTGGSTASNGIRTTTASTVDLEAALPPPIAFSSALQQAGDRIATFLGRPIDGRSAEAINTLQSQQALDHDLSHNNWTLLGGRQVSMAANNAKGQRHVAAAASPYGDLLAPWLDEGLIAALAVDRQVRQG